MTVAGLAFLKGELLSLGIPYEFMEWTSHPVPKTYWVGEYSEVAPVDEDGLFESTFLLTGVDEDGLFESTFLLTGTTKGKYLSLEIVKEQIRNHFPEYGLTEILPNGWGIAVMFETSFPVPAVEEGVHRMQITLRVKEWKGE